MNFSKQCAVTLIRAQSVATTGTTYSSEIDMADWEGVCIVGTIATANAGNYFKLQDATVTNTYSADVAGSKTVASVSANTVMIELYKPVMRFLRVAVVLGSSSAVGDMYAIQFRGRKAPVTQVSTTDQTLLVSAADGTA